MPLQAELETQENGVSVLFLRGDLDAEAAPRLTAVAVHLLAHADVRAVAFDLDAVTYLDHAGLSVFLAVLRQARDRAKGLGLICTSPTLLRLLELTTIDRLLPVYEDLDAAVQALPALPRVSEVAGEPEGTQAAPTQARDAFPKPPAFTVTVPDASRLGAVGRAMMAAEVAKVVDRAAQAAKEGRQ